MRILMCSDFYPPFIGGAERQVQLLSKELVLRGHQVAVATVWHEKLANDHNEGGVEVHRLKGLATNVPWFSKDPKRRYHPPVPDPLITWGIRKLVKRFKPDVVHAHGWIAYSAGAALFGTKIPFVVSARDYGYSCAIRTLLYEGKICEGPGLAKCLGCAQHHYSKPKAIAAVAGVFAGRQILKRKLSALHSVSTFVQETVRRDLLDKHVQKARNNGVLIPDLVIPSFLDMSPDEIDQEHVAKLPKQPYILFVGSLQNHKGLGVLIEAYKQLKAPPPMVLIGTLWPDTPKVFPPGVTVFHNVPHRAVMTSWERCLFGAAPSVWPDPLPGVVREAMVKGKAMIATRVGGNTDMIEDGETGILVPPDDIGALAEAMQRLIDDPALRNRLGSAAQSRMDSFTAQAVLPRFENLYRYLATGAN